MSDDPFLDALNAKAGAQPVAAPVVAPRAVRNNNPGNLRWDGKSQWQGMTGVDKDGFVQFDTPENGQRALSINLGNQANLHGLNTVRGIVSKYAPAKDGNNTEAYVTKVAQNLGVGPDDQIDPNDPKVNQAMQAVIQPTEAGGGMPAQPSAPAAPDPFLAALDNATKGGAANTPGSNSPADSGNPVPGVVGGDNVGAPQQAQSTWGDTLKSVGSGLAALTPASDAAINGRNYFDSARDDATGFAAGVAQIPAAALHLAGNITGAVGGRQQDADTLKRWGDNFGNFFGGYAADPNSAAHQLYKVGGEVAATAPVSELTIASDAARAAKAGKLAAGLARYGDMGIQGAIAGAGASGGKDMAKSALEGAALAPVVGAAGDVILPKVVQAAGAVKSKLASALAGDAGDAAPAVEQTIRKGSDLPPGNIEVWHTGTPAPDASAPSVPKSATPDEMRQALGSRGSNSGLEANPNLAPDVAQHVDQLRMQGVPLDQAVREAEITAVGAKPTVAAVTRDPQEQAAVWEGAKQPTPEGRALSAQIAQNNAAVVNRVQNMVQDLGGVPSQGEAAETAATSLAKASDAEKAKVSQLYDAADSEASALQNNVDTQNDAAMKAWEADRDRRIAEWQAARASEIEARRAGAKPILDLPDKPDIPPPPRGMAAPGYIDASDLRTALNNPEYANPTIDGVKQLRSGVSGLLDAYGGGTDMINLQQAEKLRQAINDAYDPMGGGINSKVGELKATLDSALDNTKAGPAYRQARAAYKTWAAKYDNPDGIRSLIKRDAQGNFVNGDNWRKAENFIGSTADKPFIQVVNQLQANGDQASLNRLKAAVLQRAYERATNNATDKLGNAALNGKLFFGELNKIGAAKLSALFSPAELSDIATTGRAAIHMNEAVPGSANTSHTASALAKALMAQGKKSSNVKTGLKILAHGVSLGTGHVGGNIVTEGATRAVDTLTERGKAKNLAKALIGSMNPAQTRAAAQARAEKIAAQLARRSQANQVNKRTAAIAAALAGGNR